MLTVLMADADNGGRHAYMDLVLRNTEVVGKNKNNKQQDLSIILFTKC